MAKYYTIRFLLAAALVYLCEVSLPRSVRAYFEYMSLYQIMPQDPRSALWWRTTWFSLDAAQVVVGWFVCRELFKLLTERRTYWWERQYIILLAAIIATAFVLYSWSWTPANSFQAWLTIRQYYRLALLVGWLVIAAWYGFLNPLKRRNEAEPLVALWCVWLASQFAMSTAGASGMIWRFIESDAVWYRLVGDVGMGVQIAAVLATALFLRRQKKEYGTN